MATPMIPVLIVQATRIGMKDIQDQAATNYKEPVHNRMVQHQKKLGYHLLELLQRMYGNG